MKCASEGEEDITVGSKSMQIVDVLLFGWHPGGRLSGFHPEQTRGLHKSIPVRRKGLRVHLIFLPPIGSGSERRSGWTDTLSTRHPGRLPSLRRLEMVSCRLLPQSLSRGAFDDLTGKDFEIAFTSEAECRMQVMAA
jgi:hypothetical protein